ncbi:alpha/beta hydrolase [Microbacterium deminutum]|uniref:Alpha/beta hydrolase n=1 Tax=Microbacterium deminutum TaxID=344164 RepID=A0ABP5BE32_9MICO
MDISNVAPSLRTATQKSPKVNIENRFLRRFAASASALLPGKRVEGVERRLLRHGGVKLRVYVPANPSGAGLLWIHGGGLVLGAAAMDDTLCGETARQTGVTIVSVDYRLAPRHPFPAAIDDCHTGWQWLRSNLGALGLDAGRLAIGGQSAGGGLAASLVQRVHDDGDAVAAQWLFCPMLDDRVAADRGRDEVDHFIWNNRSNLVGWSSYLGDAMGSADLAPYAAAARREELSGFPPTWIYTSDIELFYDEDIDYAQRLEAAGVDTTIDIVSGAPHGFEAWAPGSDLALELVARARGWLGARLAEHA